MQYLLNKVLKYKFHATYNFGQKFLQINVSLIYGLNYDFVQVSLIKKSPLCYKLNNINNLSNISILQMRSSIFSFSSNLYRRMIHTSPQFLPLLDAKKNGNTAQQGDDSGGPNRKIGQIDRPSKDFDWSYYLVKTRQEWKPGWQMYLTMYRVRAD